MGRASEAARRLKSDRPHNHPGEEGAQRHGHAEQHGRAYRNTECQRGVLRIIAAITQGEVIRQILRHLKLAADPPPRAPARVHQEAFAWSSA